MADTTLPGLLLTGLHSARPVATAVGKGTLYSCSTHSLVYQSNGTVWNTWATLGVTPPAPDGLLLAAKSYGPNPGVTMSTSGTTVVDFDATNISLTVTVPANGKVMLKIHGRFGINSGWNSYMGVREGTTMLETRCIWSGGSPVDWFVLSTLLTGVSPGAHTYKWCHWTNGGGTSYLRSNGDGGSPGEWPTIMEAYGVP